MAVQKAKAPVPDIVGHLQPLTVQPKNLWCAEYCFVVEVDFSKKLKYDMGIQYLKQIVTALLNTSGGILEIKSITTLAPKRGQLEQWKINLEEAIMMFVPHDEYRKCCFLFDEVYPYIFYIKKSSTFVTLNTHIYERGIAGCRQLKDYNTISDVIHQNSDQPCPFPFRESELIYGDTTDVAEGSNIELKCWVSVEDFDDPRPQNKDTYKKRLQDVRTERSLLSMANMSSGGYLVVGVQDLQTGSNKITGQVISMEDEKLLTAFMDSFLCMNDEGRKRKWGDGSRTPKRCRDWDITFVRVKGGPHGERRRVIVIRVNHYPGGVFMQTPESFLVNETGYVVHITHRDWLQKTEAVYANCRMNEQSNDKKEFGIASSIANPKELTKTLPCNKTPEPGSIHGGVKKKQISRQGGVSASLAKVTKTQEAKGKGPDESSSLPNIDHTDGSKTHSDSSSVKDEYFVVAKSLSWTQHTNRWDHNLRIIDNDLEKSAHKFADDSKLFAMKPNLNLTPDLETIVCSVQDEQNAMLNAMDFIKSHHGKDVKGFGVANVEWISNFNATNPPCRPPNHIADVFVARETRETHLELWTIIDSQNVVANMCWEYNFLCGRLTKRQLLYEQDPGKSFVHRVWVHCHVYQLCTGEVAPTTIRPEFLHLQPRHFVKNTQTYELKLCLARALVGKPTVFRSILGEQMSIALTCEQMEVIINLGLARFNHIEGPPGSGKTFLALHICQKYGNYVYLCSTPAFREFLIYQGLKQGRIFVVEHLGDLESLISQKQLHKFDFFIIDDSQNMKIELTEWNSLCNHIAAHRDRRLVIFADSRYQNYTAYDHNALLAVQQFTMKGNFHLMRKSLTQVHRNTRKIVSFIKSNFVDNPNYPDHQEIVCSNVDDGDDIEIKQMSEIWSQHNNNELLTLVRSLENPKGELKGNRTVYHPSNIAILVDDPSKDKAEQNARLLRKIFRNYYEIAQGGHKAELLRRLHQGETRGEFKIENVL